MIFRRLRPFPTLLVALLPVLAAAQQPAAGPVPIQPQHPLEAFAAVGSSFAQNTRIADLGWTEEQFNAFVEGVRASYLRKPYPMTNAGRELFEDIERQMKRLVEGENVQRREFFRDPARAEKFIKDMVKAMNLQRSDSGMAYALLSQGVGSRPGPDDTVVISYAATASDGRTDLRSISADHRRVKVSDLLPGLAEGVQMLVGGGSGMFILPADLTFGTGKWPDEADPGAPIIFTVNLYEIVATP